MEQIICCQCNKKITDFPYWLLTQYPEPEKKEYTFCSKVCLEAWIKNNIKAR